jgi:hypothetical protein
MLLQGEELIEWHRSGIKARDRGLGVPLGRNKKVVVILLGVRLLVAAKYKLVGARACLCALLLRFSQNMMLRMAGC